MKRFFETKKEWQIKTPSFAERLSTAKMVFQKALADAMTLSGEMAAKIEEKETQINSIKEEINSIKAVEAETHKFITNLEGLV